jgi:putative transposase
VYKVIRGLSCDYPVRVVCTVLQVSFSAYYAYFRQESHVLKTIKAERALEVKRVFEEHRRRYGAIRVSKTLQSEGIKIGRYQTSSLMKAQNLIAIQPKSFVPKTTQTDEDAIRSPNLLLDRLDRAIVQKPHEIFVGDITYIPLTDGGWLYLAAWQDMFTRTIVGWELKDHMRTSLVISALNKAIKRRKLPKGLIIHSDGGKQYSAKEFREVLKKHEFKQSMTRKNNHYDNAMAESLWSRFKAELLDKGAFDCFEDAYTEIFEYIEMYYNKKRMHSALNYQTPSNFEAIFNAKNSDK